MKALLSFALLTAGFLGGVFLATFWIDPESTRKTQIALAIYARVVLVKGLLPQLALALVLGAALDRAPRLAGGGVGRKALRALLAAGLSALAVAPTLMPLDLPTLPAVKFRGPGNFAASVLEMTAAVATALLLAEFLAGRWRERRRVRAASSA